MAEKKERFVVLEHTRFVLGVKPVTGLICAEQGIVMFYAKEAGILAPMPVPVSYERYDTELTVYVHSGRQDILLQAGQDDMEESRLSSSDVNVLTQIQYLQECLDEWKVQYADTIADNFSLMLSSGFLLLLSSLLLIWPVIIPLMGAVLVYYLKFSRVARLMNTTVVWDSHGHWVDLKNNTTNLNGGFCL